MAWYLPVGYHFKRAAAAAAAAAAMNRHRSITNSHIQYKAGVALQEWAQKEARAVAKPRPPGAYTRSTACWHQQTMRPVQYAHLRKRERFRRARNRQAEVRSKSLVGPKKKLSGEAAHHRSVTQKSPCSSKNKNQRGGLQRDVYTHTGVSQRRGVLGCGGDG